MTRIMRQVSQGRHVRVVRVGAPVGPEGGEDAGKEWADAYSEADANASQYGVTQTRAAPPRTLAQWLGVPWWFWVAVAYGLYKSNKTR